MRYFKVTWTDADTGEQHYSDPLTRWTDAEIYRREIGDDAEILSY